MSHYLWKIRPYFRQVAGLLLLGFVSGIIMNISVVLPPILLGRAIDIALALERGTATYRALLIAAVLYVGGCSLNLLAQIGKRWWLRTANQRTLAGLRANMLRGILSWPMEKLHNEPAGGIMARVIGDTQVFLVGFNEATTELLDTWLFSLSLFTAMMILDVRLALLAMALVPIAFLLAYLSANWVRTRTLAMRRAVANLTSALQEHLTGVRVLRLFGRSGEAVRRVDGLSENLRQTNLAEIRLRLGLQPVYSILVSAGVIMVVWLGGEAVVAGTFTIGSLVAFMQLYIRFVGRGHRIPSFFNRLQSAGVAYARIEGMLAPFAGNGDQPRWASFRPNHIAGSTAHAPAPPSAGGGPLSVRLSEVSFRYPGSDIAALNGVSLDVPAGSLIAVTGPIGAGKSALLRVVAGIYQPAGGTVHIDGIAVDDWTLEEKAARVAYVPQDPSLFSGTIKENLGLEDDATTLDHDLLVRSGLERDLRDFPEGVHTLIGERGIRVSGGQRQRIALARALAAGRGRSPGLLLLDDPFASIDVETEGVIIAALRQAYGPGAPAEDRATLILCSHRLAAFPQADRVIVLSRGGIIEEGNHESLLAVGGLYARIFTAQHKIDDQPRTGPES